MPAGGEYTGVLELSYRANEALTKFRFVKLAGDELVDQCDTAGEKCLGVGRMDVTADEATKGKGTHVSVLGASFVESGAAITRGDEVTTDATGRAITAVTGNRVHGVALKAAGAAGEWIPVLLALNGRVV